MIDYIHEHLQVVLSGLLLIARLGDIGSTYLVTPSLRLEMNPIARRFGWKFAFAGLSVAAVPLIPDVGIIAGVVILVASLLVTSSNLRASWLAGGLGEDRYAEVFDEALRKARPWQVYSCIVLSSAFFAAVGLLLTLFYPDPEEPGWWFGMALVAYPIAIGIHHLLFLRTAYARVRQERALVMEPVTGAPER
jgi:hypothetical protein